MTGVTAGGTRVLAPVFEMIKREVPSETKRHVPNWRKITGHQGVGSRSTRAFSFVQCNSLAGEDVSVSELGVRSRVYVSACEIL